jgi:hypothetical protein
MMNGCAMRSSAIGAICLAAILMQTLSAGAQVVAEKVRQERLAAISAVMDESGVDMDLLVKDMHDPFSAGAPSSVLVTANSSGAAKAEDPASTKSILKKAADDLRPTGIMTAGAKKFVVAADGGIYAVGSMFTVQLGNSSVEVTVEEATGAGCVLKFKDETMTVAYDPTIEFEGSATKAPPLPEKQAP